MLIRTMQEFKKTILAQDRCTYCNDHFDGPGIVILDHNLYHVNCARTLAYSLLFELTGAPQPVKHKESASTVFHVDDKERKEWHQLL